MFQHRLKPVVLRKDANHAHGKTAPVIAKNTTARGDCAISIRAVKTCIKCNFIHLFAKFILQIFAELIVPFIGHRSWIKWFLHCFIQRNHHPAKQGKGSVHRISGRQLPVVFRLLKLLLQTILCSLIVHILLPRRVLRFLP